MDPIYSTWFGHTAAFKALVEEESEELVRAIEEIERDEELGDD